MKRIMTALVMSFTVGLTPAMAASDKDMMKVVQEARTKLKGGDEHAQHLKAVAKEDQFRGVYYGYLPCDHCAGIKMTLSLKAKKNYLLVTQYAQASNKEFYEKGKYDWNEKTQILTLLDRKKKNARKFYIKDEKRVIQLTAEGKRVKGKQEAYTLTRADGIKARSVHIH